MKVENHKMAPGHLLDFRCPKTNLVRQWRVVGVYLGGLGQESVVEVETVGRIPATPDDGKFVRRMFVPEAMTRMLDVRAPGLEEK